MQVLNGVAQITNFQRVDQLVNAGLAAYQRGNGNQRAELCRDTTGKIQPWQRLRRTAAGGDLTEQANNELSEHHPQGE